MAPENQAPADGEASETASPFVRSLMTQGIRNPRVLAAFGRVPRRFFVPEDAQASAEADGPLDIGFGQTISQPYIVAAMLEALDLSGRERVLEIGTGSGYQTALLCEMLPLDSLVRTIEIVPELTRRARRTLLELGYDNVELRLGDGGAGWAEAAPFDAIVVSAAPERVPRALLDQLAPGGRLVLPVGPDAGRQELQRWWRRPVGGFERQRLMAVRFVPLTGSAGAADLH